MAMPPRRSSRTRPLRTRPGARFTCAGDGLCCTDVHALGPVGREERRMLRLVDPGVVVWNGNAGAHVLATGEGGGCVFLGDGGCALHASLGPMAKPRGCRRFPLGLVATPDGGRITTEHRCPCRTLGARPPLTPDDALEAVSDAAGRLRADLRVGDRVAVDSRRRPGFRRFVDEVETPLLEAALAPDARPEGFLDRPPFPELSVGTWPQIGVEMLGLAEGGATRFHAALAWVGDALAGPLEPPFAPRPWADAFDRAAARPGTPEPPDAVLSDWIADHLWSLRWAARGNHELARRDLATRVALARTLAATFDDRRPDVAHAEALTVVDLVAETELWEDVLSRVAPSAWR